MILLSMVVFMGGQGCAMGVHSPGMTVTTENNAVVLGKITTKLIGPTRRYFQPAVQFFEVRHDDTKRLYRIDLNASDKPIVFTLPAGTYRLTRVMVNEGAFRAIANPELSFELEENRVNYVGTWEFRVASPTFNRTVQIVVLSQLDQTLTDIRKDHPSFASLSIVSQGLTPSSVKTRLYEVSPYPKFRYFNRHQST